MFLLFFFNDTATTEIYTLSLHDALPILSRNSSSPTSPSRSSVGNSKCYLAREIWRVPGVAVAAVAPSACASTDHSHFSTPRGISVQMAVASVRSEEHTSELQSQSNLRCRLLLEKK